MTMDHDAESPRIRNPYDNLRTTEQLLKASVQVQQLILAELTAPPVRKDHSEGILVLLASILGELQQIKNLLTKEIEVFTELNDD